jgi:hypothetical protein
MVNIARYRAAWTGFAGAPGVNTFYCLRPDEFQGHLSPFYEAFLGHLPNDVHIALENSGDMIDPLNGQLMSSWSTSVASPKQGSNSGNAAAPAGLVVTWLTGDILDGTRLRGRTFIVPLAVDAYAQDGTLSDGMLTIAQNAADDLVTAANGNFCVWHRPRPFRAATSKLKELPAHAGGYSVVTGARVSDRVAVLRSRRG